jgi:biotin synthase-like enzyme
MGPESPHSHYSKLQGTDTRQLTRELREHGIRVQGSTIIGLEHHTRENISGEIEYAVSHHTDFHQFMLYTPVPGTPLFKEMSEQGRRAGAATRTIRTCGSANASRARRASCVPPTTPPSGPWRGSSVTSIAA